MVLLQGSAWGHWVEKKREKKVVEAIFLIMQKGSSGEQGTPGQPKRSKRIQVSVVLEINGVRLLRFFFFFFFRKSS